MLTLNIIGIPTWRGASDRVPGKTTYSRIGCLGAHFMVFFAFPANRLGGVICVRTMKRLGDYEAQTPQTKEPSFVQGMMRNGLLHPTLPVSCM